MKTLTLMTLLMFLFTSTTYAISPDQEVWIHKLPMAPDYPMMYAYKNNNTYIYLCVDEDTCNFYKYPSRQTAYAHYTSFYAFMYQSTYCNGVLQHGIVQCFFLFKKAIQIQMYDIIPFIWFLDLEKVANVEDFPENQFIDFIPTK